MIESTQRYMGEDLAFIIPTKDRPEKISNLLASIAEQGLSCGRIIIVDGGESVRDIVLSFADQLPVEYYECYPPSQLRQRNFGISQINSRSSLVAFLDDDIVLEPNALESMLSFWNKCEPNTGGVAFNIVNIPPWRQSWLRTVTGMSLARLGRVLPSGYNVATSPTSQDIRVQWLSGGATVWRKEILEKFSHKEISSRWAICEDVIFSYPIGKRNPLFVCADARVRHEHVYDHQAKRKYRYYGRTITLWRWYFVESHAELSRFLYLWMLLCQIGSRCLLGMYTFDKEHIEYAVGQAEGAMLGLFTLIRRSSLLSLLNEDTSKD